MCLTVAADVAMAALYEVHQNRHGSLTKYRKRFKTATEVLKHMDVKLEKAPVGLTNRALVTNQTTRNSGDESNMGAARKTRPSLTGSGSAKEPRRQSR